RDGLARVLTVGLVVIRAGGHAPIAPLELVTGEIAAVNYFACRRGLVGVRLVPRFRKVHPTLLRQGVASAAEMENLAKCGRVVTMLAEQLRKSHYIGQFAAQQRGVVGDTRLVGTQASEERRTARVTNRILRVGVFKTDAARGEAINVGRLD